MTTSSMFVTIETWNGREILPSLSDIALLLYTLRYIVRILHRVGQSMIANCDYRKAELASGRDADYIEA